jgi:HrpA-like RNA helicase
MKKRSLYKSLEQKTLKNILIRELVMNFGYDNQIAVAETLAERVLSIIDEYAPKRSSVKPGQVMWLAVDIEDRPGRGKNMAMTKLKPVTLTLVSEEDVKQLNNGSKHGDLLPGTVARMLLEAEEQGGLLSMTDLAVLLNCSPSTVRKARETWEKRYGRILPTRGTIHDLGTTFTHKRQIMDLHLEGYFTSEIARKTSHDPSCVDRYIDDFQRVLMLKLDGQPVNKICFYTGLGKRLVNQYLEYIEEKKLDKIQLTGKVKFEEELTEGESRYPES